MNKELTVPRVLLWPTFFTPTEMLPVERVVADDDDDDDYVMFTILS